MYKIKKTSTLDTARLVDKRQLNLVPPSEKDFTLAPKVWKAEDEKPEYVSDMIFQCAITFGMNSDKIKVTIYPPHSDFQLGPSLSHKRIIAAAGSCESINLSLIKTGLTQNGSCDVVLLDGQAFSQLTMTSMMTQLSRNAGDSVRLERKSHRPAVFRKKPEKLFLIVFEQ